MAQPARRLRRLAGHVVAPLRICPVAGPGDAKVPAPQDIELSDAEMAALRKRYDEERDKRLRARPEGSGQYPRLADLARSDARFAQMLEDPYPKVATPHPLTDSVEVCIVGAGYGGLCTGARLVMEGVEPSSIRLVDKAGDVGGTWYWNRYPGAMCDIESYVYMPLCEEMGYVPTEKYAHQPEIYRHARLIAETYGLYKSACFGAQVTGAEWDEAEGMWSVRTDRGDAFRARYVVVNFGVLTDAKLPGVPGIERFQGHMFHTSRWDYGYTGGSSEGGLDRLGDKRVALVGTGATAVQVTPHLATAAKELFVFQRTPSSVDIRNNVATTQEFAKEYLSKPGWQAERQENFFRMTMTSKGADVDLVQDGWTDIIRNLAVRQVALWREAGKKAKESPEEAGRLMKEVKRATKLAQFQQMEKVRRRADLVVRDPATAEALKPWYDQFCKRPCFHDDYLDAFNQPGVQLVHTDGRGIDRVTEKGVVANGVEYEVDCIVMSTGFEVGGLFAHGRPSSFSFNIVGKNGVSLQQKWDAEGHRFGRGPKTFRSYSSSGFPNLLMQNAPQGVFTTNFVYALDESAKHFAHLIARMQRLGHRTMDVKPQVEDAYVEQVWRASPVSDGKTPNCTPGYYNNEGKVEPAGSRTLRGNYPGTPLSLFHQLAKERREGSALQYFDIA